jgi:hypothetical protein
MTYFEEKDSVSDLFCGIFALILFATGLCIKDVRDLLPTGQVQSITPHCAESRTCLLRGFTRTSILESLLISILH